MTKVALFAFNGDPTCFIHVLLNALDLDSRGVQVCMVIEGAATRLIPELGSEAGALHKLYRQAREKGLVQGACRACSAKTGTLKAAEDQGLPLLDDINGHPSMGRYMEEGYSIISF